MGNRSDDRDRENQWRPTSLELAILIRTRSAHHQTGPRHAPAAQRGLKHDRFRSHARNVKEVLASKGASKHERRFKREQALSDVALSDLVASRLIGTAILVPVIAELFLRLYLQDRISGALSSRTGVLVATFLEIGVSSAAFCGLQDRWLAAFVAGVQRSFRVGREALRTGGLPRLHAAANIVIAAAALRAGDWSLI